MLGIENICEIMKSCRSDVQLTRVGAGGTVDAGQVEEDERTCDKPHKNVRGEKFATHVFMSEICHTRVFFD